MPKMVQTSEVRSTLAGMFTKSSPSTSYERVEEAAFLTQNASRLRSDPRDARADRTQNLLSRISIAVLTLAYGMLLWAHVRSTTGPVALVLGNEGIFDNPPVIYRNLTFQRAGFHSETDLKTPYEGRPNEENNAAWHRLLSVGMVSISDRENDRLPGVGSAEVRHRSDRHVVQPEVFHQLHCLAYLRNTLWQGEIGKLGQSELMHAGEIELLIKAAKRAMPTYMDATDHCIDYLRQSLMCHGDLTPIVYTWQPTYNAYSAKQETDHTCRDWDTIWKWAEGRNSTGLRVHGSHTAVKKTGAGQVGPAS